MVSATYPSIAYLPKGAAVGTSSTRRAAQLLAARPDVLPTPIRGNVDSRIQAAVAGDFDAIILAAAGLERLGLKQHVTQRLPYDVMLPAPGQGAIAVQCRADDEDLLSLLSRIDDRDTRLAVTAERAFLHALGGGCATPIAALATIADSGDALRMDGLVASVDGKRVIAVSAAGSVENGESAAAELGEKAAQDALSQGAGELLDS
jgi:hydroxymethylbilane synthase